MNHAMTRAELTEKILQIRIDRDLTWKWIAEQSGLSKEFTTAAVLGQMALPAEAARKVGRRSTSTATRSSFSSRSPTGARWARPSRPIR